MQQRVDEIASSKDPYALYPDWSGIRRGWYFGSDSFPDNLLDRQDGLRAKRKLSRFSGPEIRMHNERESLRLLSAGLKRFRLTSKSLESLTKGSPEKMALVWYIRSKTTVSNDWLSEHIFCGHPSNVPRCMKAVTYKKSKTLNRLDRTH